MVEDLFRKQALDARRGSSLGQISIAQPLSLWVLTAVAVCAAVLIGLLLAQGSYARRFKVNGQLVPSMGLSTVMAPANGVVSKVGVTEGTRVEQGQALAILTMSRVIEEEGETAAALRKGLDRRYSSLIDGIQAQQQLQLAKEHGLRAQLVAALREHLQIEIERDLRQEQIRIADETLQRLKQLQDERYVSLLQIKQQESSALSLRGEHQALERQASAAQRSIAQLRQAIEELPGQAKSAAATATRELALLDQERVENQARGALQITSPIAGVVTLQQIKVGQTVQAGQSLISLLPSDARLEAELLAPSRVIATIAPGDRVLLRYQGYPYQKFGHQEGRVSSVSRSAVRPERSQLLAFDAPYDDAHYRVTVALAKQTVTAYGAEEQLKPGMRVDADILAERRKIIEWILEPIHSMNSRIFTR